jgi:hypothetical protein
MRWIPAISGAIATAAALLVLTSVPQGEATGVVSAPIVTSVDPVAPTTSASMADVAPPVAPGVPELGESVANVLADGGFTEFVGSTELGQTLPKSVVDLLVAEEIVLVVPDNGDS